jgi:hypothetical protein
LVDLPHGAAVVFLRQVVVEQFDDLADGVGDLYVGDDTGRARGKIFRIAAFQKPGGGPPMLGLLGRILDGPQQIDFDRRQTAPEPTLRRDRQISRSPEEFNS